jgi:DNA-binding transcriptional LysR family regulator
MELRSLRAFVEVVRQGGFTQAAKTVFSTQPTISKAVKQLEDQLGVQLLDRSGHKSELTAAGEIVYRRALAMLAERDDLIAELGELRGLERGVLRLGLPLLGSSVLFAPLFAAYRSRYPAIEIRLAEHGAKTLQEILLAGDVELVASLLPLSEEFDWQDVRAEPLMVLLPDGHPAAGQARTDLKQLSGSSFILFEEGFALNEIILESCRRRGFTPKITARSGQIDFIVELVAAGLGIAFLPRLMTEQFPHVSICRVLLDEPQCDWHMVLAWRRNGYLSHAARAWLALARDAYPQPSPRSRL